MTKVVYDGEVLGKRPRGGPRMRWTSIFAQYNSNDINILLETLAVSIG